MMLHLELIFMGWHPRWYAFEMRRHPEEWSVQWTLQLGPLAIRRWRRVGDKP